MTVFGRCHMCLPKILFLFVFPLAIILFIVTHTTFQIAFRDFLYLTRPIWDKPVNHPKILLPHYYSPGIPPEKLCSLHGWRARNKEGKLKLPRVIDAFVFSVEFDLLEIRLKELWDVVDLFVLLESNVTFTGKKKRLYFQENKEKFQWAQEKLLHYVAGNLTLSPKRSYNNEITMREYFSKIIRRLAPNEGDLIIASDVDEIPFAHTINLLKTKCVGYPRELHLDMRNYLYSFEFPLETFQWRPHITTFRRDKVYVYHHVKDKSNYRLADSGWHCSFCFRYISQFIFKMTSYSHSDRVTTKKILDPSEIQRKICEGRDIFDMMPEAYTFKELISQSGAIPKAMSIGSVPQYVMENVERFKFLLPGGCVREKENISSVQEF